MKAKSLYDLRRQYHNL